MLDSGRKKYPRQRMRVVQLARENAIMVRRLLAERPTDPDMTGQMLASSRSTADNLGEAETSFYRRVKLRLLDTAVRENNELAGQLEVYGLPDDHPLHDRVDHVGRMITTWAGRLGPGWGDR